jgi:hypothetical protein
MAVSAAENQIRFKRWLPEWSGAGFDYWNGRQSTFLMAFSTEYSGVPWYWVPEYVSFFLLAGIGVTMLVRWLGRPWLKNSALLLVVTLVFGVTGFQYLLADTQNYQQSNRVV